MLSRVKISFTNNVKILRTRCLKFKVELSAIFFVCLFVCFVLLLFFSSFNPFSTNVPLLYLVKTSENLHFFYFYRADRCGTLAEKGLILVLRSFSCLELGTRIILCSLEIDEKVLVL